MSYENNGEPLSVFFLSVFNAAVQRSTYYVWPPSVILLQVQSTELLGSPSADPISHQSHLQIFNKCLDSIKGKLLFWCHCNCNSGLLLYLFRNFSLLKSSQHSYSRFFLNLSCLIFCSSSNARVGDSSANSCSGSHALSDC